MKKYIIFLFLIITNCSNIFAQQTFTLQDAITAALNKNTTLIKQQNNLATQSAAIKNAYGNLLPNLSASGSWSWSRVTDKGGGTQIDYFGRETVLPSSKVDTRGYSISAGEM
jgi:outer membrane protein TolC